MVYTAEDFEKKLGESGVNFSDADLQLARKDPDFGMTMIELKQKYAEAQSPQARALIHSDANDLRRKYGGYSGDEKGSGFYVSDAGDSLELSNSRDIENFSKKIADRAAFEWNPDKDENWQQMQKAYRRESDLATRDTLTRAAMGTGGTPSSAAVAAAAQQGNYYAAALADKAADARAQALNEYQQEYQNQLQGLDALQSVQNQKWNRKNSEISNASALGDTGKLEQMGYDPQAVNASNQAQQVSLLLSLQDYGALRKMGFDTSVLEAISKNERASTLYSMGDYDALDRMGYDTSTLRKNQDLNVVSALIAAHAWDTLDKMGYDTTYWRALDEKQLNS